MVQLIGTGIAPRLRLTPGAIALRSPQDWCSPERTLKLTNLDKYVEIAISGVTLLDEESGDFYIDDDECSGTALAPAQSCSVLISFCPSFMGVQYDILEITDDATGNPQQVKITGRGAPPLF